MKPVSKLIPTLLAGVVFVMPLHGAGTYAFGPGVAGLTGAGSGLSKISSAEGRVSVRFTASKDGPLTEFTFGVIPGGGFASKESDVFVVSLHGDQNGLPGKLIARASKHVFNDGGARARTAWFAPGASVKGGAIYHLVIASPGADDGERIFAVTHAQLGRVTVPVHSLTMETTDPAAAVLTSEDGGASWSTPAKVIAAHEIVINGEAQGWGYTGTFEIPLMRGPEGTRYAMQTFTFVHPGSARRVIPRRLRLALRPQGALTGQPVNVFAHIVTPVGFHTMAEASATVTLTDAGRFDPVELPFKEGSLVNGRHYILILGLSEEVTTGAKDFLFMRGYNWGIGSPNLTHVSWQGIGNCAYASEAAGALGEARIGGDLPFVIDYEPAP